MPSRTIVWKGRVRKRFESNRGDAVEIGYSGYRVDVAANVLSGGQNRTIALQSEVRAPFGFHLRRFQNRPPVLAESEHQIGEVGRQRCVLIVLRQHLFE